MKKSTPARSHEVRQGYACRCANCEGDRAGHISLLGSRIFCAGCGHGYIDLRQPDRPDQSSCGRCGCTGPFRWLDAKPVLPFMPKPEVIDRLIAEARELVTRTQAMYRPEHFDSALYFDPVAVTLRIERVLQELDAQEIDPT